MKIGGFVRNGVVGGIGDMTVSKHIAEIEKEK